MLKTKEEKSARADYAAMFSCTARARPSSSADEGMELDGLLLRRVQHVEALLCLSRSARP